MIGFTAQGAHAYFASLVLAVRERHAWPYVGLSGFSHAMHRHSTSCDLIARLQDGVLSVNERHVLNLPCDPPATSF